MGVERVIGDGRGIVRGVELADGGRINCEAVLVGIGIVSTIGPLSKAGARCGVGVVVDKRCRTTLPNVFAIGDCAPHPNRHADVSIRLESMQNANDHPVTVAKAILGGEPLYDAIPWFWSNLYDLKLQTIGLSAGHDAAVLRGDQASRSFSSFYLRDRHVVALYCVNNVKDYVQGRALVARRQPVDPSTISDVSRPLKTLAVDDPRV